MVLLQKKHLFISAVLFLPPQLIILIMPYNPLRLPSQNQYTILIPVM